MSLSWSPSDGVIRRLFSAALAVVLAFTVVVIVPGSVPAARADQPPSDYILIFANAAGTAAGTAVDERFEGSVGSNDVAVTVRGVTMTIHLSCSELFNLYTAKGPDGGLKARDGTNPSWGYGEEFGHSPVEATEPRLWDFSIFHPEHQGGSICGFSRDGGLPGIDIEKATNGDDADTETGPSITVDDTVTWTYVVTNTGDFPLSNIVVTDDRVLHRSTKAETQVMTRSSVSARSGSTKPPAQPYLVSTPTSAPLSTTTTTDQPSKTPTHPTTSALRHRHRHHHRHRQHRESILRSRRTVSIPTRHPASRSRLVRS